MRYLLDTDTCIGCLRLEDRPLATMAGHSPNDLGVSAVTYSELLVGSHLVRLPGKEREKIAAFLAPIKILAFGEREATFHATLLADARKKGRTPGSHDLLIAATALAHELILVTGNTKHFAMIEHLKTEDWLRSKH